MKLRFVLFSALLALAHGACADRPHNIFDDDWTPPKIFQTPKPAIVKPHPPAPDPPNKIDPPTITPKDPTPTISSATPPARLAIPSSAAQAAVRKVMKDVFAARLADRSIPARRKLTTALLAQVEKTTDAPTDQFVLLAAAIDSAIESVDLSAAFKAADKMSESFDVDPIAIKIDAALKLGPKSAVPDQAAENVGAAIELSDQLARAEDFTTAVKICAALQPATGANAALRTQLQQHVRDLGAARDAAERYARDLAKLTASPDDPAANLAVGRYLCFIKNDWQAGLPLLAKSTDTLLKTPAIFELSKPTTPEEIAHLADIWWEAAGKQPDNFSKAGLSAHAAALYEPIIDKLTGLRKVQVENRIAEMMKSSAKTSGGIDLLKLVGKRYKAIEGTWAFTPSGLKSIKRGGSVLLPYNPPEEYDLHVVFERLEGRDSIGVICPLPHGTVSWIAAGWGDVVFGFATLKNGNWETVTKRELPNDTIRKNIRHTCVIRVRKDKATATLDGKLISEFNSDGAGCQVDRTEFNGKAVFGFNVNSPVEFSEVTITEITGQGRIVTDQK